MQKAAESLHLTQPNVSRTLKALEEELNAQLFVRTVHGVEITEEGELLKMRAQEILSLVNKTKAEFVHSKESELSGEVRIAAGESEGMRNVIRAMSLFKARHPKVEFSVSSGNSANVAYQLNVGLADLGIVFDPFDVSNYEFTCLPWKENWCVYLRKDDSARRRAVYYASHASRSSADPFGANERRGLFEVLARLQSRRIKRGGIFHIDQHA